MVVPRRQRPLARRRQHRGGPPRPTLGWGCRRLARRGPVRGPSRPRRSRGERGRPGGAHGGGLLGARRLARSRARQPRRKRSEEHTSELQSPCNLVCRLLLEKKKKNKSTFALATKSVWLNFVSRQSS